MGYYGIKRAETEPEAPAEELTPEERQAAEVAEDMTGFVTVSIDPKDYDAERGVWVVPEPLPEDELRIIPGRKDDSKKLDLTLLFDDMPHALEAVAEVLQWAITKKQPVPYDRGSWQGVEPFQLRYRAAMLRHVLDGAKESIANGLPFEQTTDHETELLQLQHIACGALFQLEMAIRKTRGITR